MDKLNISNFVWDDEKVSEMFAIPIGLKQVTKFNGAPLYSSARLQQSFIKALAKSGRTRGAISTFNDLTFKKKKIIPCFVTKGIRGFIDWKIFEGPLNEAYKDEDKDLSKGGRPPFGKLMMFKALLIQGLYNLSDDQLEYQIVDRASFKRFLVLKKSDKVPDSKTFWVFREYLIEKEVIEGLFVIFNETLDSAGVFANEGKMVDASFVEAPRQRNTREENKHIKETGTAPENWKEKPHKLCQKDIDAVGQRKTYATYYG